MKSGSENRKPIRDGYKYPGLRDWGSVVGIKGLVNSCFCCENFIFTGLSLSDLMMIPMLNIKQGVMNVERQEIV